MNVLIVEDEFHTANLLEEFIQQSGDFVVVEKLESVAETVLYLNQHQNDVDLLFLDIQLSDGKSFEIFQQTDVHVPVVFCTAYDEYGLQAIKTNGIDYILKPFNEHEIFEALNKYKKLISNLERRSTVPIEFKAAPAKFQNNFLVSFREKTIIKKAKQIALFHFRNDVVYLHDFDGTSFPLFKKLEFYESNCDPNMFYRINRQMLISREAVQSFEPYLNRKIVLQLSVSTTERAVVSRLKVTAFKNWLRV